MATPPTFVLDYEGASWDTTTSPKTTGSFNPAAADVLVALVADENDGGNENYTYASTPGSDAWTENAESTGATDNDSFVHTATTIMASSQTGLTVSATRTAGSGTEKYGLLVARFSDSDGIGNSAGSPRLADPASWSFTTNFDNSAIVVIMADWTAADGTTRTWRTVNGVTPTVGNGAELLYFRNASNYAVYCAYYSDAGTAGPKTLGLTAPTGTRIVAAAVEVRGITTPPPGPYRMLRPPVIAP